MTRPIIIACLVFFFVASVRAGRPIEEPAIRPISAILTVIDPATGRAKDLLKGDRQSFGRPVVVGNTIFIASSNRSLYAVDAHNGQIKWSFAADAPLFGLVATDKAIFLGAGGSLYSLDLATGKLMWKYDSDMAIVDPVLADGAIIFNAVDGPVALENDTGKLRWQLPVQWGYFVFSPLSDHRLCVWKPDEIYVVETERGKTLWQNAPDQSVSPPGALPTAAVAVDNIIYQLRGSPRDAEDWSLHARDAGSGRELWKTPLGQHESAGAKTTIAGNTVYAILEDGISALDLKEGTLKWQATVKPLEAGGATPQVGRELLYVPELGGDITALDEKAGKAKWSNTAPKPSADGQIRIGGMCVTDGGVYVTRNEQVR